MEDPKLQPLLQTLRQEALRLADGELEEVPAAMRQAQVLRYVLANLPIAFDPDEPIAGRFGWDCLSEAEKPRWQARLERGAAAPEPAPEPVTVDDSGVPVWARQTVAEFIEPEADPWALEEEADAEDAAWTVKTDIDYGTAPPAPQGPTPDELDALEERFGCAGDFAKGNVQADYERYMRTGFLGLLTRIQEARFEAHDEQDLAELDAMEVALWAVIRWAERYADLAEAMVATADPGRAEKCRELARICRRVPRHTPATFREALQSVWFIHAAVSLSEDAARGQGLGRLDQYLSVVCREDRKRGAGAAEQRDLLAAFLLRLNTLPDADCLLSLGGVDRQGREMFNPLSRLIFETVRDLGLPQPRLAIRVHREMPDKVLEESLSPALLRREQVLHFGEFACRRALLKRGIEPAEVSRWGPVGEGTPIMLGAELSNVPGIRLNLLLPLELALNGGEPLSGELPVKLLAPARSEYPSFLRLLDAFTIYLFELEGLCHERCRNRTLQAATDSPNPFASVLLRDCLEMGRDRAMAGARHHSVVARGLGLTNVAQALGTIKRLVYDEQRLSLPQLVDVLKCDWEGHEELLAEVRAYPAFGNGEPEADQMLQEVAQRFGRCVGRHSDQHQTFVPSFQSGDEHLTLGRLLPASADGRRAGEPLGRDLDPLPGRLRGGLGERLASAASLGQSEYGGGQQLHLAIPEEDLADDERREALKAAIRQYFEDGGLSLQCSALTPDDFREGGEQEDGRELRVRYFGRLMRPADLDETAREALARRQEALRAPLVSA